MTAFFKSSTEAEARELCPQIAAALDVLYGGGTPWMGHDPSPLVEVLEGYVYVWSDGALGHKPESESPLTFTSDQFDHAVRRAANDIAGFVLPLLSWLEIHAPRSAKAIVQRFKDAFVNRNV